MGDGRVSWDVGKHVFALMSAAHSVLSPSPHGCPHQPSGPSNFEPATDCQMKLVGFLLGRTVQGQRLIGL